MRDTILCLCDLTGVMARPWVEHGYQAVLVDPQHGCDHEDGAYLKLACTIEIGGIMSVSRESVHPDYIPEDFGELLRMAVDYVYEQGEHYSEDALLEAFKPAIDKHDRQVAERAFELGCVAVDAEEHGVGCRFTVGQLEELSRDYGRDAYSVNNPYGRGES